MISGRQKTILARVGGTETRVILDDTGKLEMEIPSGIPEQGILSLAVGVKTGETDKQK